MNAVNFTGRGTLSATQMCTIIPDTKNRNLKKLKANKKKNK